MRVLILRDRKAGHVHRAEGLAKAVGLMTVVDLARVDVRPRLLAHEVVRRLAFRFGRTNPLACLRFLYDMGVPETKPDVLVSSGKSTAAAGLLLSRLTSAKFIYSGGLTHYPLDANTLCVQDVPTPTTVDHQLLPKPRRLRNIGDLAGATVSLLIGGDSYSHTFSEGEWRRLHATVEEAGRKFGVRWWVSTSRRTPALVADLFAGSDAAGSIQRFIDFRTAGVGSADKLFEADAIVTTEDSRSMIAEAVAALRPVVALRSQRTSAQWVGRFTVDGPAENGVAIRSIGRLSADGLAATLVSTASLGFDPREPLVRLIAPFLGLEPRLPLPRSGPN